MLGWEIFISRAYPKEANAQTVRDAQIASWMVGLYGLRWIDDLVVAGKATFLGGNGYPARYQIQRGNTGRCPSVGCPCA